MLSPREAHACIVPSQRTPDASTAHAGLKEQYTNATPTANFPNGHGMNSAKSVPSHGQSSPTPSGSRPTYRPPHKPRQFRGSPNMPPEGDVEMQPAPTNDSKHPNLRKRTFSQIPANTVKTYPWNVLQQLLIRLTTTLIVLTKTPNKTMIPSMVITPLPLTTTLPWLTSVRTNLANQDNMPMMALRTTPVPPRRNTCITMPICPLITKMSPTWGTHGCVTLPILLPRLILYQKPLRNPYYWIAPLSETMPSTDPLALISRLRTQDHSTLLHVSPMTQRLSNKTILAIFPQRWLTYTKESSDQPTDEPQP